MFFQLLCAAAKQQKAAFRPTKIADQQNYRDRQGYHSRIYRKFCCVSSDEDDVGVTGVYKKVIDRRRRATEMLEKSSFHSEFGEDIMKLVREVNHYVS